MPLVASYLCPHGMQLLPHLDPNPDDNFLLLTHLLLDMKSQITQESPELVVLITPHGIMLDDLFGIYVTDLLRGYLPNLTHSNVDGDLIMQQVFYPSDPLLAEGLQKYLIENGIASTSLTFGSKAFPIVLSWAEIVPLYFFHSHVENRESIQSPPVLIISLPKKRLDILGFQPQLHQFGQVLGRFLHNLPQKSLLIISGDLSHVHSTTGPYGYSPHAKRFDELINQWIKAKNSEQRKFLWDKAFTLVDHVKACGLATLSVLNGVFHASTDNDKQKSGFWRGYLYGYGVPTYFGMSLARFSPQ